MKGEERRLGKILVIAEKPDAGANIAKVLGCTERKHGYIENDTYIITWAIGHLIGLKMPEEHDVSLKEWKMSSLPLIFDIKDSLKVLPDTQDQFQVVKSLINRTDIDYIINAGDAGREGYLIQSWIYRYAGNRHPVKILWASSLTDEALRKAFANLKEEDVYFQNLLQEAEARAEADYLLGMNYSRALTLTKSRDRVLSYGRCQTPLLNLLVLRDLEIEGFVPSTYYQLQATYEQGFLGNGIQEDGKAFNIADEKEAKELLHQCHGKEARVISCEREDKKKKAPLLFSLADLQKEMGRKYKYTPDKTLEITQRLYETYKIVSYPRTDSCCLTMDLYNEIGAHIQSCNFGKFHTAIEKIDLSDVKADRSYFNDAKVTDHHALIPTIHARMEEQYQKLNEEERNIFDAIVYRFLAIFYPPYEYASTTLVSKIGNLFFRSRGISVKSLGYKEVIQENYQEKEEEEQKQIPYLQVGDRIAVNEVKLLTKKTSPPPRYTVDSIISLMQKYGIGTSATMAEIIKKLQNPKRQFVVLENGTYHSTSLGRKFISIVPESLKSPELTKNIEEQLSQIGNGELSKETFLKEIIRQICDYIQSVKEDVVPEQEVGSCPYCHTPVTAGRFGYGCQTEECFRISNQLCGKRIVPKMVADLLSSGRTGYIKGFVAKSGKPFDAKLVLKEKKVSFEFAEKQRMR